ncbi:hypothetical protein BJX61DRAFT_247877 [Aspergillus egyptiacus]|nr:hypothetical protein BJX61DRAFT_247877 [Aspergillus egyptiacus]
MEFKRRKSELLRFVQVGFKTRLVCKDCKNYRAGRPLEDQKLFLRASFPEIVGQPPRYTIAQAIEHELEQAKVAWRCENCINSNNRSNSAEPSLSTKHIDQLPEVLFVRVNYYGHKGQLNGDLDPEEALTIPANMQFPGSPNREKVLYELYSVIFRMYTSTADGQYTCAIKGPASKWTLINNDFIMDEMSLGKVLGTMGADQRCYIFAYRCLPLNGFPVQPTGNPALRSVMTGQNDEVNGEGVILDQALYVRNDIEWTMQQRLPFRLESTALLT